MNIPNYFPKLLDHNREKYFKLKCGLGLVTDFFMEHCRLEQYLKIIGIGSDDEYKLKMQSGFNKPGYFGITLPKNEEVMAFFLGYLF